jgi:arylsulfatase A
LIADCWLAHRNQPFFLYLAHNLPHMPLFRSKAFEHHSQRGLYGDAVEEIDSNVGRILAALRELKLESNTLVLYTSDNGPWAPYLEQGGSAGLLRGAKASTWEGGMRVPAVFWWSGTITSSVATGLGSELDLLQTFASLAGAQPPTDRVLDGYDLSPTLKGNGPSPRHSLFYYASTGAGVLSAVRHDSFKAHFVVPTDGGAAAAAVTPQLYNLDEDPSEKFDLAAKRPDVLAELRALADEHAKTVVTVKNQIATRPQSKGSRP